MGRNIQLITADIYKIVKRGGCPVCTHLEDVLFGFLSTEQHAIAETESGRAAYVDEKGYCPRHTWQLAGFLAKIGVAKGFSSLLSRFSEELTHIVEHGNPRLIDRDTIVRSKETCRVCKMLRDEEEKYISLLAESFEENEVRAIYVSCQGVCLGHLDRLLKTVTSADTARFLVLHTVQRFQEVARDLKGYAEKRETRMSGAYTKDEQNADLRAVNLIAGSKNIVAGFD